MATWSAIRRGKNISGRVVESIVENIQGEYLDVGSGTENNN